MDLMKIGLYAAAGFGAYSLYEKLSKKEETARRANLQGTDWQTRNMSNACGACGA